MSDRRELAVPAGTIQVPVYRVATCHRWTHGTGPGVWRSPAGDNADFSDVHTCGSVWMCSICAAKITSSRRDELVAAIAAWRQQRGGEVYLATRTVSHDKYTLTLAELLQALSKALSRAKGRRRALALAGRAGVVGTIRALEVTHGEINGWHPHTHELIFARPGQRGRLLAHRNAWVRELIKRGLAGLLEDDSPRWGHGRGNAAERKARAEQLRYLRRHAYTVQLGDKAADYVAKFGMEPVTEHGRWGPASELTRGHQKTGARLTGRTPFELLRLYVDGDKRAGMLFRDFAVTFQGRAQLYWSPGLRAALVELCEQHAEQMFHQLRRAWERELYELARAASARARYIGRNKSDEDIAATRSPKCTELVKRLSGDEWRLVLRTNARFELLDAAHGGLAAVDELLDRLRTERATHGDNYVADWRRFDRGRWYGQDTAGESYQHGGG